MTDAGRTAADSMELRPLTREDLRVDERTTPGFGGRGLSWAGVLAQDMEAELERDVASVAAERPLGCSSSSSMAMAALPARCLSGIYEWEGDAIDEIGWSALPEHQGRGLASAGLAEALRRADEAGPLAGAPRLPCAPTPAPTPLSQARGFASRGSICDGT